MASLFKSSRMVAIALVPNLFPLLFTAGVMGWFGIAIHPDWRSRGVGGLLMDGLIAWARATPAVEKINLKVLATNERAIGLYKSKGFVEEGRAAKTIKYEDGSYVDDVSMGLIL